MLLFSFVQFDLYPEMVFILFLLLFLFAAVWVWDWLGRIFNYDLPFPEKLDHYVNIWVKWLEVGRVYTSFIQSLWKWLWVRIRKDAELPIHTESPIDVRGWLAIFRYLYLPYFHCTWCKKLKLAGSSNGMLAMNCEHQILYKPNICTAHTVEQPKYLE